MIGWRLWVGLVELAGSLHGACSELAGELGGGLGDSGYLGQAELGGPERVGLMDYPGFLTSHLLRQSNHPAIPRVSLARRP